MKDQQDAYGHAVYDHLNGKRAWEIVERDDGNIGVSGGPKVYFSEYRDWPAQQRRAMRHVRGNVLDIGCGAGRHSLYLQKRGFRVLGIDHSPLAVKVCKLRGLRRAKLLPIQQLSPKLGRFATVLMLGNNFGLFGSLKGARRLLAGLHRITTDQGRIIAESRDPYETDDPVHLRYHARNRRRGRMSGQVRIRVRYKTYATPWFDYLLVSSQEMQAILAGTGWRVRRLLDPQDASYIAVIEKHDS